MGGQILNALANRNHIVDNACILRNSGGTALVASAAATAAQTGQSVPFDTGGGYTEGKLFIDVDTCATGTTIGPWVIVLQGARDSTFATYVTLAQLELGTAYGPQSTSHSTQHSTGVYVIPWSNDFGGEIYRWLRCYSRLGNMYATTAASNAPSVGGLDYSAYLTI